MAVFTARTISVSIDRDWHEVYDFVSTPQNLPRWAAGLGSRFEQSDGEWLASDPSGRPIRIRFTPRNELGVVDHVVRDERGSETHNAMRVVPNGTGAEVLFTVLKPTGTTDEAFAADAAAVETDLRALKVLLER